MPERSGRPGVPTRPATVASLAADLDGIGVRAGDTVMVHASLRALGHVVGGAQAVLEALRRAVGDTGTLVMPTQSWQLCDPAFLAEPHVPEPWWPVIRANLPPYDPHRTPSRTMGALAELFRTQPGSRRSSHPHRSIAAHGPAADAITAVHDWDCPAGERSPLAALYDLGALVLLLGVGPDKITALHLAEHRADYPGKHEVPNGAPTVEDGVRQWVTWNELWVDDGDFTEVVTAFTATEPGVRSSLVGAAHSRLLPMRALVDFAAEWFTAHR